MLKNITVPSHFALYSATIHHGQTSASLPSICFYPQDIILSVRCTIIKVTSFTCHAICPTLKTYNIFKLKCGERLMATEVQFIIYHRPSLPYPFVESNLPSIHSWNIELLLLQYKMHIARVSNALSSQHDPSDSN